MGQGQFGQSYIARLLDNKATDDLPSESLSDITIAIKPSLHTIGQHSDAVLQQGEPLVWETPSNIGYEHKLDPVLTWLFWMSNSASQKSSLIWVVSCIDSTW